MSYSYLTGTFPWTAVTANKLLYDPADTQSMQTVISMDGLGRVLQTAKQGEARQSGARVLGWNLSGAIAYDGNGRTVQEGQPVFAAGTDLPSLAAMRNPTSKSYDAQDRVVSQVLPDTSTISTSYLVNSTGTGLVQHTVDPLGNIEERQTDGRGNITAVTREGTTATVLMSATYRYDGLSQILAAVDSQSHAVSVGYDLLGRRVSLSSPDAGLQTMSYDASGNLAQKVSSVLRAKGEAISYQYDGLNRLTSILYPESPSVQYTYGAPGAPNNGAARLVQRTDEGGTVSYQYGKLGETVQMSRSITSLIQGTTVTATLSYVSDYLGRLQQITYPDGEVLTYGYDAGGQVRTATAVHLGVSTPYVRDIGYDEFGQRTYIEYGNGVRTSYAYDPMRRWLKTINTLDGPGSSLQAMSYSFDLVGNILGYSNSAAAYATSQSYSYDGLYQLVSAQGTASSHLFGTTSWSSAYQQSFSFDGIGNMTSKVSTESGSNNVGDDLGYSLSYSYYAGSAHQAEIIGSLYYRYDLNGNMVEEKAGSHGTGPIPTSGKAPKNTRYFIWDEENRLERSLDNSLQVDYRYGADGQRAIKSSSKGESLYFDSMWLTQKNNAGLLQSKNVYVGNTRIATQLNQQGHSDPTYEQQNTFWYHPDHLGSSQLVTDYTGVAYEHLEYTPYGESWVEEQANSKVDLPYKFTGKELDSETGLYYYGARYMSHRLSRWISPDPMEDYLPAAPIDDETKKKNQNLPGMGGVFNPINLALYDYASNNPVRYVDPTGKQNTSYLTFVEVFTKHKEDYAKLQKIEMNFMPIPLRNKPYVTSEFGPRTNPFTGANEFHKGTDISTPIKTDIPILAAITGTVTMTKENDPVYGNYVVVQSFIDPNLTTIYGHLSQIDVSKGDFVGMNVSVLGIMGSTGEATGPHLHFEVRYKGVAIDPLLLKPAGEDTFQY